MIQFSLIIPVYNSATHLPLFLKLIEKIEYINIEIIFINDGSTDTSLSILEEYKQKSEKSIYVYSQKNSGPGIARNKGLEHATGDYIWFIDSDDSFNVHAFEYFNELIEYSELPDILYFGSLFTHEYIDTSEKYNFLANDIEFSSNKFSLLNEHVAPWNKLLKKTFLDSISFHFLPYYAAEDFAASCYVLCHAKTIVKTNKNNYTYVMHKESLSNTQLGRHKTNFIFIFDAVNSYIKNYPFYKEELTYILYKHSQTYLSKLLQAKNETELVTLFLSKMNTLEIEKNTYYHLEQGIITKFENFLSWKITKPLRKITSILRRFKL